jgi:hypothetical protein
VSVPSGPRTVESCLTRAVAIKTTAKDLLSRDDEWFAVCYFYAAFHTVKAAFIEDPVFDDPTRLRTFSEHLIPDDRFVGHHQGRLGAGPRKLGVNDIVALLYPSVIVEYRRLHAGSIAVRYGHGLAPISTQSIIDDYDAVTAAYQARLLTA